MFDSFVDLICSRFIKFVSELLFMSALLSSKHFFINLVNDAAAWLFVGIRPDILKNGKLSSFFISFFSTVVVDLIGQTNYLFFKASRKEKCDELAK